MEAKSHLEKTKMITNTVFERYARRCRSYLSKTVLVIILFLQMQFLHSVQNCCPTFLSHNCPHFLFQILFSAHFLLASVLVKCFWACCQVSLPSSDRTYIKTIHTIHTYHTYKSYIHTIYTKHACIPYIPHIHINIIRTIHTYHTYTHTYIPYHTIPYHTLIVSTPISERNAEHPGTGWLIR